MSPENMKRDLFKSINNDDLVQVKKLIKEGVNVNAPESAGGWSALHYAAQMGNEDIVKELLAAGADPNYIGAASGQEGTVLSSKPLQVAQSSLNLANMVKSNPKLHFKKQEDEKLMRNPNAVTKFEKVVRLLEKVTKD